MAYLPIRENIQFLNPEEGDFLATRVNYNFKYQSKDFHVYDGKHSMRISYGFGVNVIPWIPSNVVGSSGFGDLKIKFCIRATVKMNISV